MRPSGVAQVFDVVVDETGHNRVVRAKSSRRCIHGKPAQGIVQGGSPKTAEVCPACTYEATRLFK